MNEKVLDRLKKLFMLNEDGIDYIRKAWLHNETADCSSTEMSIGKDANESFAKLDEQRKEYVTDIIITYSNKLCPTCSHILLFNADLYALYWCEVCKLGISWELKVVDGYIPEDESGAG